MNKVQKYMVEAVCAAFFLLFVLYVMGYCLNGFWGFRFELGSVWQGISALSGSGVLAMCKYIVDSWANSSRGVSPYDEKGE